MSENNFIEIKPPAFIPSRDAILEYGYGSYPKTATPEQRRELDSEQSKIYWEADRRFRVTLGELRLTSPELKDALDVDPFEQIGPYAAFEMKPSRYNSTVREAEYLQHHRDQGHGWGSILEGLKNDPDAIRLLQRITAKRLAANTVLDQYMADKKITSLPDDDLVKKAIDKEYDRSVFHAVQAVVGNKASFAREGERMRIRDKAAEAQARAEDPDFWENYGSQHVFKEPETRPVEWITAEQYMAMAKEIANRCRSNSYLAELFQVFDRGPKETQSAFLINYPERLKRILQKDFLRPEVDPQLKTVEQQAREYITQLYRKQGLVDLPEMVYVDEKDNTAWQDIITKSEVRDRKRRYWGGYCETSGSQSVRVPVDIPFVFVNGERESSKVSTTIFEELYHASRLPFMKSGENGLEDHPFNGSFLEEGLARAEIILFFGTHFPSESVNGKRFGDLLAKFDLADYDFLDANAEAAGFFFRLLARQCNMEFPDFIEIVREARTLQPEGVERLRDLLNGSLGEGAYHSILATDGNDIDKILNLLHKYGVIRQDEAETYLEKRIGTRTDTHSIA